MSNGPKFESVLKRLNTPRQNGPHKTACRIWMQENFKKVEEMVATRRGAWSWEALADALNAEGVTGRKDSPLSAQMVRSTWMRLHYERKENEPTPEEIEAANPTKTLNPRGFKAPFYRDISKGNRNRSSKLGAVLAGFLLCGTALPAWAQIPTIDVAAIAKLAEELTQLQEIYRVGMGTLGSLQRMVDPNTIARGLANNVLPGAGQLGSMITGGGGGLGGLTGLLGQYRDRNTYYRPEGGGYTADMLERSGNTYAGTQAASERQMEAIAERMAAIEEIQSQLSTVTSEADLSAIKGRLAAEQAYLAGQQAQVSALGMSMNAQQAQYQLMETQRSRQAADELLAWTKGGGPADVQAPLVAQTVNVPTYQGY